MVVPVVGDTLGKIEADDFAVEHPDFPHGV